MFGALCRGRAGRKIAAHIHTCKNSKRWPSQINEILLRKVKTSHQNLYITYKSEMRLVLSWTTLIITTFT